MTGKTFRHFIVDLWASPGAEKGANRQFSTSGEHFARREIFVRDSVVKDIDLLAHPKEKTHLLINSPLPFN